MNKLLLALLTLLSASGFAQPNTWTSIATFEGDGRQFAVSFEIDGKLYLGTGADDLLNAKVDFWEYDPVGNDWVDIADFEGDARFGAVGFSIDGKGYVALGAGTGSSTLYNDVWEYDPVGDDWTQKADFEGTARAGAVVFVIDNKAYVGTGQDENSTINDFWEFDPVANDWTQKAPLPGEARSFASAFAIGTKGYVGLGGDADSESLKDVWEYNSTNNQWTQLSDFPGEARASAIGFTLEGRGYFGAGGGDVPVTDFWAYDQGSNEWFQVADFAGGFRFNATGAVVDGMAYVGTGTDGTLPLSYYAYSPKLTQTITFGALAGKNVGDPDFALTGTASSTLEVEYESSDTDIATIDGDMVTITGGGTVTITAIQPGDDEYFPATSVEQDMVVAKTNQAITFNTLPAKTFGDGVFVLTATASSNLAVTYESSNTTVATISGSDVTIVGAGTTTITAKQAGNASYNPAPDETEDLEVVKANQSITFTALEGKTPGDAPFALTATASSNLVVAYESSNTAVATVIGSTVTLVGEGTTTITAKQPGNTNYNAAADETEDLVVAKLNQTITFGPLPTKNAGDAAFNLNATSTSNLTVSYSSSNLAVATVSGNTVTILGGGSTDITASQAGDLRYNAAAAVVQTLTVSKANQTITFAAIAPKKLDDAPFDITATASSGLTVTFTSADPAVATVSGSTITLAGVGSTFITATQAGNTSYNAASVSRLLTVTEEFISSTGQGEFWGLANGGDGGVGAIFRTDALGTGVTIEHQFAPDANGFEPRANQMVEVNGKLYGMMNEGGAHNRGMLFEFNPATGVYAPKHAFNSVDGSYPAGKLALAANGKLYGVTTIGGGNNMGTIFEYDIATSTFTTKHSFTSAPGGFQGSSPYSGLTLGPDEKLYGMVFSGLFPSKGYIYSFDPGAGTVANLHGFDGPMGAYPFGELALVDGKFYGSTNMGGTHDVGVLFEYDPASDTYTVHHSFVNSGLGYTDESRNMVLAPNGKLYGTSLGGAGSVTGVIFEFDPATKVFTDKVAFDHNSTSVGGGNRAIMSVGSNGKLYGTATGGANSEGLVFEFDPGTGQYQKIYDFNQGGFPASAVTVASNGKLYGMTKGSSGAFNGGALWELNLTGNIYTKKVDFSYGLNGSNPQGKLTLASNGKYYGIALGGEHNRGVLFELDPQTKTYAKKHDFNSSYQYVGPLATLAAAPTGKIYGVFISIGSNDYVYEYDPATETYTELVTVSNAAVNASGCNGELTYFNGKLYGWTASGGAGAGVLYEINLATNTFTKRADLTPASGTHNKGMVLAADGKFYGTMSEGGANSRGTLFEFDPATNVFTKKYDFLPATGGTPTGLVLRSNGKLYGTTLVGGANDYGVIFEYDPLSSTYTKMFDFNPNTVGYQPSSLAVSSNGKLYGTTALGGPIGTTSSLFEFDPETSTYTRATSIERSTPLGASVPGAVAFAGGLTFRNSPLSIQSITFETLGTKNYVPTLELTATASSGLPITYTSEFPEIASVSGSTLTIHTIGTTRITASQPGNALFTPAPNVTQTLTITAASQSITFEEVADGVVGGPQIVLTATATSGLPVSFSTTGTKVTISGNEATPVSAGLATISAVQGGSQVYQGAPMVDRVICINPAKATVSGSPAPGGESISLSSNTGDGNQWFHNGTEIPGATSSTYSATQPGLYKVKITIEGCEGEFSNEYAAVVTGTTISDTDLTLHMYPNPASTELNIVWPSGNQDVDDRELTIYDMLGRKLDQRAILSDETNINVSHLKEGTYILRATQAGQSTLRRFMKE